MRYLSRYLDIAITVSGAVMLIGAALSGWPPGRLQALAGVIGLGLLIISRPAVRRGWQRILETSLKHSEVSRASLQARPSFLVIVAAWFACLVTLGETSNSTYGKEVTGFAITGFEYFWRVPIGYGLLFGVIAIGGYVVFRRWPGERVFHGFLATCVFIVAAAWLPIAIHGLHYWAIAALALGVTIQLTRFAWRHAFLLDRTVRMSLAVLVIAVVAPAVGFATQARWTELNAVRQLPAVDTKRPNVLLLVADTLRAKSLGIYGYERQTSPNLDRFAQRGVVFDFAMSTSPWTLPSHGSLFTGHEAGELSAGFTRPLDETFPTLAESLTRAGYLTAGFAANRWYGGRSYGLSRGFMHYEPPGTLLTRSVLRTSFVSGLLKGVGLKESWSDHLGRRTAADLNTSLLDWIAAQEQGRPFFAFLNYYDTHAPYEPPEHDWRKFRATRPEGRVASRPYDKWTPVEVKELNDAYDGTIAYLDEQLESLFRELHAREILDNTIVIVTSDHGEQFGEHNLLEHSNSLYMDLLHVPLVIVHPGKVPAGTRVSNAVSLRSIPATVLDLVGLPNTAGFPGESLAGFLGEPSRSRVSDPIVTEVEQVSAAYPDFYPARIGPMKSIFSGNFHYIRNFGNGREELYAFVEDQGEVRELSAQRPDLLTKYRKSLEQVIAKRRR